MKHNIFFLLFGSVACAALTSCFKDEPLNAEADIQQAFIHSEQVDATFYNPTDTLVNVISTDSKIEFFVRPYADRTALAPEFRITDGATISPASGSVHNFKDSTVVYTVTSQDGQWTRQYEVSIKVKENMTADSLLFDFENYALETTSKKYYVWTDTDYTAYLTANRWATGNAGFKLSNGFARATAYPTVPAANEGVDGGNAVKMVTRKTGDIAIKRNMRIAAGNLFLGRFDALNALEEPMQATSFGLPFAGAPTVFSGYYKYKPGTTYQDRDGNPVAGKTDAGNIYAVFYRNVDEAGNAFTLHGNDVLTSDKIVATALIGEVKTTDEWTYFSIPFTYFKAIDRTTLENYGYNLAIVCTSSDNGADFEGAVGSTLTVDKFSIKWE